MESEMGSEGNGKRRGKNGNGDFRLRIPFNSRFLSISFSIILFTGLYGCQPGIIFTTNLSHSPNDNSATLSIEGANEKRNRYEVSAQEFVIATDHHLASEAGIAIWKLGGNVVDAFVAASFVVSVVRPQSTGLLGGGFAVLNLDKGNTRRAFDFRERAPARANREMYLDTNQTPIPGKTLNGAFSAGVPGNIFGLMTIHKKYGRLKFEAVVKPALIIAKKGFPIYLDLVRAIESNWSLMNPPMQSIFGTEGRALREGEIIFQEDLSRFLERIVINQENEMRSGATAVEIAEFYKQFDNFITLKDLKDYRVLESSPIEGYAFGRKILTMPPPSSGVHLITIFQVWDELNQKKFLPKGEVGNIINITESMRVGFRDRAMFGGDPGFNKINVPLLTSREYAKMEVHEIERKVASGAWPESNAILKKESYNTTHISVMDKDGNAVSSTQSINGSFGAKLLVPRTGMILNNTMDDFSVAPGVPNLYGLIGSHANSIAPGKTPLSSMSPTIVLDEEGKSEMAIGAPGGSQIPTTIFNTLFRYKQERKSLYESASYPRLHHQFSPDILFVEPEAKNGFPTQDLPFYKVQFIRHRGKVFVVAKEGKRLIGVSDPRGDGIPLGL